MGSICAGPCRERQAGPLESHGKGHSSTGTREARVQTHSIHVREMPTMPSEGVNCILHEGPFLAIL